MAQNTRTVLVLDASGSMWGQINGRHKIEIAREVIGQVVDDIPADRALGLVAYGHNRKGDCTDIEAITEIGTSRDVIRDAVNRLNPKGKTPLSDAVIFAANQLRYTEEAATVILISDGIETCEADPCAVGAELEATGVDFTAHVVGFDVSEPEALAQLQCLAENTGGQFISASNAGELSDALDQTVVAAVEPEPEPLAMITMRATENEGGPLITSGLSWIVQQAGGGEVLFTQNGAGEVTADLPKGTYDFFVTTEDGDRKGEALLVSVSAKDSTVTIPIEMGFPASVRTVPDGEIPVGSEFVVYWEGPAREGDYVTIVQDGAEAGQYLSYAYHTDGQPLKLTAPVAPGAYEVRYILRDPTTVLASVPVTLTDVTATLDAPDAVAAGETFDVSWDAPGYPGDWITIVPPDADPQQHANYAYPRDEGAAVELTAATEPGRYELRYVLGGKRVIATRAIEVTDVSARLSVPQTVSAGAEFDVAWTGPGNQGDWVTIVAPDEADGQYKSYFYATRDAEIGVLKAPLEEGDYEVRYVQAGKKVLTRVAIVVQAVSASLEFSPEVSASSTIKVTWTGPDTPGDYITYGLPGEDRLSGANYAYSAQGSPAEITAPVEAGDYEMIYIQSGKKVLARVPFSVTDVSATLATVESGIAGTDIAVDWSGPATKGDYITVADADHKPTKYHDYFYAVEGKKNILTLPREAGTYEIRYIQSGKKQIAVIPISVEEASASVVAPASDVAGKTVTLDWTGPGAKSDLVTVAMPDAKDSKYEDYFYATKGGKTELELPLEPGTYEVLYVLNGKKVLFRQPIEVTPARATLDGPREAIADAPLTVNFDGPNHKNDLVVISTPDQKAGKYVDYAYVNKGSPAEMDTPKEPGEYELRYMHRGKKTLAVQTITVVAGE